MVIGFEMFPRRVQPALDRWVAGELTEAEFLQQAEWGKVWSMPAELYLPLFHFARMNRIPMLALNIDAERFIERLAPLPLSGTLHVSSRLIGVHPRGKGNAFVESESEVRDAAGTVYVRMVNGSFRRGVERLGDIEPFEGSGQTFSVKIDVPARAPDVDVSARIADNQAHVYRLSGDYNPLHIDPDAAKFGGFDTPILHGLCTFGHCAQLLLGALAGGDAARFKRLKVRFSSPVYPGDALRVVAWHDGPGRVVFEARVDEKVVVSNAYFEFAA